MNTKEKSIRDYCVEKSKQDNHVETILKRILAREYYRSPIIDLHQKLIDIGQEYSGSLRQNYCITECKIVNICVIGQMYKRKED